MISLSELHNSANSHGLAFYVKDQNARYLISNEPANLLVTGSSRSIVNLTDFDIFDARCAKLTTLRDAEIRADQKPRTYEWLTHANQRWILLATTKVCVFTKFEMLVAGVSLDISAGKSTAEYAAFERLTDLVQRHAVHHDGLILPVANSATASSKTLNDFKHRAAH